MVNKDRQPIPEFSMKINNNLVAGGSGSGKTRYFRKPNLMPMYSKEKDNKQFEKER